MYGTLLSKPPGGGSRDVAWPWEVSQIGDQRALHSSPLEVQSKLRVSLQQNQEAYALGLGELFRLGLQGMSADDRAQEQRKES